MGHRRSNSLSTYIYTPEPSYTVGVTLSRVSSMNTNTNMSPGHNNRTGFSRHSRAEEFEGIVSTKTITHLDRFGNTQSVTTEIVRALPDGSNIVEKTTNYSKTSSRCNSAIDFLSYGADQDKYNMSRINEELNDFAYSYLDSAQIAPPAFKHISEQGRSFSSLSENSNTPDFPRFNSSETTGKHLKSILKKSPSVEGCALDDSKCRFEENSLNNLDLERSFEVREKNIQSPLLSATGLIEQKSSSLRLKNPNARIKFAAQKQPKYTRSLEASDNLIGLPCKGLRSKQGTDSRISSNVAYDYGNHHRSFKAYTLRSSNIEKDFTGPPKTSRNSASPQVKPKMQPKNIFSESSKQTRVEQARPLTKQSENRISKPLKQHDTHIWPPKASTHINQNDSASKQGIQNSSPDTNLLRTNSEISCCSHKQQSILMTPDTISEKLSASSQAREIGTIKSPQSQILRDQIKESQNPSSNTGVLEEDIEGHSRVKSGKFKLFVRKYMLSK